MDHNYSMHIINTAPASTSSCCNCMEDFRIKSKGFHRFWIEKPVVWTALVDILDGELTVRPSEEKQFLCDVCARQVISFQKHQARMKKAKKAFLQRMLSGSYLDKKVSCGTLTSTLKSVTSISNSKRNDKTSKSVIKSSTSAVKSQCSATKTTGSATKTCSAAGNTFSLAKTPQTLTDDTDQGTRDYKPFPRGSGICSQATLALQQTNYMRAINIIITKSAKGRQGFHNIVQREIRKEVNKYGSADPITALTLNKENFEKFCWLDFFREVERYMPLTLAAFKALITTQQKLKKCQVTSGMIGSAVPGLGMMLGMGLSLRQRNKYKFLPALNSFFIRLNGGTQMILDTFGGLGFCMGKHGSTATLKRLMESKGGEDGIQAGNKNSTTNDDDDEVVLSDVSSVEFPSSVYQTTQDAEEDSEPEEAHTDGSEDVDNPADNVMDTDEHCLKDPVYTMPQQLFEAREVYVDDINKNCVEECVTLPTAEEHEENGPYLLLTLKNKNKKTWLQVGDTDELELKQEDKNSLLDNEKIEDDRDPWLHLGGENVRESGLWPQLGDVELLKHQVEEENEMAVKKVAGDDPNLRVEEESALNDVQMIEANNLTTNKPNPPAKYKKSMKDKVTSILKRDHKKTPFGKYFCNICSIDFALKSSLTRHNKKHNDQMIVCQICGLKKFFSKWGLQKHIQSAHTERKFICEHCGKEYRKVIALQNHLRYHKEKTS